MIRIILVVLLTGISAYTDHRSAKIRNSLTIPFIVIGLVFNIFQGNTLDSVLGVFVPQAVLLFFWKARLIGAGDIKVFMAIGSIIGLRLLLNSLFPIFFVSLVYALLSGISSSLIIGRLKALFHEILSIFLTQAVFVSDRPDISQKNYFRLGYGIFIGSIIAVILNHYQVFLIFYNIYY